MVLVQGALVFKTLEVLTQLSPRAVFSLRDIVTPTWRKGASSFRSAAARGIGVPSQSSQLQHLSSLQQTAATLALRLRVRSEHLCRPYSACSACSRQGSSLSQRKGRRRQAEAPLLAPQPVPGAAQQQQLTPRMTMIPQQAHPFHFAPKGAAGTIGHSRPQICL